MVELRAPALGRGFAILDLLAKEPGLTFTEIRKRLNLPKSSAHHLVSCLVDLGMLLQQTDGGFVLGLRLFELGAAAAGESLPGVVSNVVSFPGGPAVQARPSDREFRF